MTFPDPYGLKLDIGEDDLLAVEYDLPREAADDEERSALERERYDEQILAALVAPSF